MSGCSDNLYCKTIWKVGLAPGLWFVDHRVVSRCTSVSQLQGILTLITKSRLSRSSEWHMLGQHFTWSVWTVTSEQLNTMFLPAFADRYSFHLAVKHGHFSPFCFLNFGKALIQNKTSEKYIFFFVNEKSD